MTTEGMISLTLLALSACISAAMSTQDSSMICLGQPRTFSCEVPKQGSLTRLEWRIDFEGSSSEESVTRRFTSADPEGYILRGDRSGVSFVFNLTSKTSSNLVSVMTVTVDDINVTALINNATVNCGETNPKVFRIIEGPPSSQMNLTHDRMKVQWNQVTVADHYIISVFPLSNDNESESTLMTSNSTIQLPLQYNQDYNISVMASNCAGNSTPAEISMRVGHCALSTSKFGNINFKNNTSSGYMEGSWILFYCYDNRNEPVIATCMKNGSWSPDPHTHKCHTASELNSKMTSWYIITAIMLALIALVLLVIISAILVLAVYRKHSSLSHKIKIENPNYYSDLPSSEYNENQELGIYSLLQPEEQMATRPQSTDQTVTLVYADVGSTLSRNPKTNANISLQLGDTCVQYADLKHHQTSELHSRECNSHTDTPVDLDNLLIHLRSDVTPKWHQFGEAVGIPEEILEKYSNYPREECIVEVFDYWLRNYPSTDKPTWKDVADILSKIDLHQLAEKLLQNGAPVPVDMNAVPEYLLRLNLQSSQDEVPPPLPPKMADLDKEMMSSDPAARIQPKSGSEDTLN